MNTYGNLALQEFAPVSQPAKIETPRPVLYEITAEMAAERQALYAFLAQYDREPNAYQKFCSRGCEAVPFLKAGKGLTIKTVYATIQTGITCKDDRFQVLSLKRIEKIKDYAAQMQALRRLVAVVKVFTGLDRVTYHQVENITEDAVDAILSK